MVGSEGAVSFGVVVVCFVSFSRVVLPAGFIDRSLLIDCIKDS